MAHFLFLLACAPLIGLATRKNASVQVLAQQPCSLPNGVVWGGTYSPTQFCFTTASTTPTITASMPSIPTGISTCLLTLGGADNSNTIQPGCGAALSHLEGCFTSHGPWTDPYNLAQSEKFQACLCETSSTNPFTINSPLWMNFTGGCMPCLSSQAGIPASQLRIEQERLRNFCSAAEPNAYLFLIRLEGWVSRLIGTNDFSLPSSSSSSSGNKASSSSGTTANFTSPSQQNILGAITSINLLAGIFTTEPPLANLAFGESVTRWGLTPTSPVMETVVTSGTRTLTPYGTVVTLSPWEGTVTEVKSWSKMTIESGSRDASRTGKRTTRTTKTESRDASQTTTATATSGAGRVWNPFAWALL